MSLPQPRPRIYIENGPRAGETLSAEPDPDGRPPQRIMLSDARPGADRSDEAERTTTYVFSHVDFNNGLYVYRTVAG